MPSRTPVCRIRRPTEQVEDVAVVRCVRLCDSDQDGYLWVHPSVVINITPGSGNISTIIQNPKEKVVLITVSWYGRFVDLDDGQLNSGVRSIRCVSPEWVCDTHRLFYLSYYFSSRQ